MKNVLVELSGDSQKAYDSIVVKPKALITITSDLALKIITELARHPACAMDLGRILGEHEQKIYYHLRKLEQAGIVRLSTTENRYGMTAKIYDVISPVIAAKLYEGGFRISSPETINKSVTAELMSPFILNMKLNSKIIIGDPNPHGKYEKGSSDGPHVNDLSIFMGSLLDRLDLPCYKLDTNLKDYEFGNNLILVGSPLVNTVTERVNKELPIYFDKEKGWSIVSKLTGKVYDDDLAGILVKCNNPFNKNAKILVIAGRTVAGTIAAIKALTKDFTRVTEEGSASSGFAKIVKGVDKDSDGVIDAVQFIE